MTEEWTGISMDKFLLTCLSPVNKKRAQRLAFLPIILFRVSQKAARYHSSMDIHGILRNQNGYSCIFYFTWYLQVNLWFFNIQKKNMVLARPRLHQSWRRGPARHRDAWHLGNADRSPCFGETYGKTWESLVGLSWFGNFFRETEINPTFFQVSLVFFPAKRVCLRGSRDTMAIEHWEIHAIWFPSLRRSHMSMGPDFNSNKNSDLDAQSLILFSSKASQINHQMCIYIYNV